MTRIRSSKQNVGRPAALGSVRAQPSQLAGALVERHVRRDPDYFPDSISEADKRAILAYERRRASMLADLPDYDFE